MSHREVGIQLDRFLVHLQGDPHIFLGVTSLVILVAAKIVLVRLHVNGWPLPDCPTLGLQQADVESPTTFSAISVSS